MTHADYIFMLGGIHALQNFKEEGISVAKLSELLKESCISGREFEDCTLGCLIRNSKTLGSFPERIVNSLNQMLGKQFGDYVLVANGEGEQRHYKVIMAI